MIVGDIPFDATRPVSRPVLPEFPDALRWVNRRERLRLTDWRGQIVLVLFWNASSVSSANMLGELRQLEKKMPGAFVSVCVHTPRFVSQQTDAAVLKAAHRNRLRVPVANDGDWLAWKRLSIPAWPTTLRSSSLSIIRHTASRTRVWSSITTTLMVMTVGGSFRSTRLPTVRRRGPACACGWRRRHQRRARRRSRRPARSGGCR